MTGGMSGASGGASGATAAACTADDTFGCATELVAGERTQGQIEPMGDVDFFVFTTTEAGVLDVSLDPVPAEVGIEVRLYDDAQTEIARSTGTEKGQGAFLSVTLPAATYYLKLNASRSDASSNQAYTVLVKVDRTDPNEINDTFASAAMIELDKTVTGTTRPANDEDYFKVTTKADGVLDVALDPVPADIQVRFRFYDKAQKQITEILGGGAGQSVFFSTLLKADTYYLWVAANGGSSEDTYKLRVALDTSDPGEINNTFAQATMIDLATPTKGKVRPQDDDDYFSFRTNAGGTVTIKVDPTPADVTMGIYLYDSMQAELANVMGVAGQTVMLQTNLAADTRYYLWLGAWNHAAASTEPYTLTVTE